MGGDASVLDALIRNAVSRATAELTAENAGLRAECERLRAELAARPADDPELDATDGAHPAWWRGHDYVAAVYQREIGLLRAMVDGREVAPFNEEITVHAKRGGLWLICRPGSAHVGSDLMAFDARDLHERHGLTSRWLPLSRDGRPCAWPEVTRG